MWPATQVSATEKLMNLGSAACGLCCVAKGPRLAIKHVAEKHTWAEEIWTLPNMTCYLVREYQDWPPRSHLRPPGSHC